MDDNTKKKTSFKKVFFIFILIIIILGISYVIYDTFFRYPESKYISTYNRDSYILLDAAPNILNNYINGGSGKLLVIFWASWCNGCTMETADLSKFMKENLDVEIIIVSHDESKSDIEKYLKENSLNWFVIYDGDRTIRKELDPESTSVPYAYILDRKGNILNSNKGSMDLKELYEFYNNTEAAKQLF